MLARRRLEVLLLLMALLECVIAKDKNGGTAANGCTCEKVPATARPANPSSHTAADRPPVLRSAVPLLALGGSATTMRRRLAPVSPRRVASAVQHQTETR